MILLVISLSLPGGFIKFSFHFIKAVELFTNEHYFMTSFSLSYLVKYYPLPRFSSSFIVNIVSVENEPVILLV